MTDLATLSLKIDSSGMAPGNKALDEFANKAGMAEGAAIRMSSGVTQATGRMAQSVPVMNAAAQATKLTAYQYQQLGFQVNDVVTQIASGAPAMQVLAQQGGQVYQVLGQGPGGVGGALKEIAGGVARFASTGVGAFGLVGAAVLGFGLAINKALSDQRELERGLTTGLGRAAGVTADEFRRIAQGAAEVAQVSRGSAESAALAFAQTGKIGADMFADLTVQAERYSRTVGISFEDATKELAKAFADPQKGMDALDAKLNFLDGSTRNYIRSLVVANDRLGAQRALLDALSNGPMVEQAKRIETIGDLWEVATRKAADYANAAVRATAAPFQRTNEDLLAQAQSERASLSNQPRTLGMSRVDPAIANRIRQLDEEIARLSIKAAEDTAKAWERAEEAKRNAITKTADDATRDILRIVTAQDELIQQRGQIEAALALGIGVADAEMSAQAIRRINEELEKYGEIKNTVAIQASQTIYALNEESAALEYLNGQVARGYISASQAAQQTEQNAQLHKLAAEAMKVEGTEAEALWRKYDELSESFRRNAQARAAMQAAQTIEGLRNEAEVLRLRINLAGEENGYIEKRIALLQVEQQIKAMGDSLSVEQAEEWRRRAREVANLKEQLEDLNSTADKGSDSAKRLGDAWRGVSSALSSVQMASIGAGSALQTAFAAAFSGAGGAQTSGQLAVYSTGYAQARAGYSQFQQQAQQQNSAEQSALRNTISALERNLERMSGRWDGYQPSAYAEKNPLLFYDFQQGSHFTEAERTQIKNMESQIALAQKQLAELEQIAQILSMPASQALRDPMTFRTDRNMGPSVYDNFVNVGGVLVNKQLASIYGKTLGFAKGGSFMVGGDGGTDTTPVRFMATKGERVTVETPAQQRSKMEGSHVNDNRDMRTINLTVNITAANDGGDPKLQGDRLAREIAARMRRIA